jgi:hypothetical protein
MLDAVCDFASGDNSGRKHILSILLEIKPDDMAACVAASVDEDKDSAFAAAIAFK